MLSLWKTVVAFRRQFATMRSDVEHDVFQMRSEISRFGRNVQSSCFSLDANVHQMETQNMVCLISSDNLRHKIIFCENKPKYPEIYIQIYVDL